MRTKGGAEWRNQQPRVLVKKASVMLMMSGVGQGMADRERGPWNGYWIQAIGGGAQTNFNFDLCDSNAIDQCGCYNWHYI